MKRLLLFMIYIYQKTISPDHGIFSILWKNRFGCRYHPTCSMYAVEAINRYGAWEGMIMAWDRISRCNPSNPGGHDPVKNK